MFKINKKLLYTPLSITIGLYAKTHANVFNDDVAQIGSDTKQNVTNILQNEFLKHLKEDQIVTHVEERKNRGKAWNTYHTSNHYPNFILYPKNTQDVSEIMKICHRYKIPVVPFGGGTSLEGHTLTTSDHSVCIDMNNMKDVLSFHPLDLDIKVQAGLGYIELNEMLAKDKLWFPLDPGPGASIGGMCACRCSGSTAVRYGSMRDNVLNLTAVLHDGTIVTTGTRARKSSAGYDLTRLFIGSEGTLGIVTEVNLKLHGIPQHAHALRICFDDIRDAAATARDTLNCGVTIGRCEMLDDEMMKVVNAANSNINWPERFTLLYEIVGPSDAAVKEQVDIVNRIAAKHRGFDTMVATNPEECKNMWAIRKACIWSAMSQYPDLEPMITDVCVPLSQLPLIMHETRCAINKTNLPCPIVAHAGDGNFHVVIMFDPNKEEDIQQAKALAANMAHRAIELSGTCTGEHGIGVGKIPLLYTEYSRNTMKLMELIKVTLDPFDILNPGKIFNCKNISEMRDNYCEQQPGLKVDAKPDVHSIGVNTTRRGKGNVVGSCIDN